MPFADRHKSYLCLHIHFYQDSIRAAAYVFAMDWLDNRSGWCYGAVAASQHFLHEQGRDGVFCVIGPKLEFPIRNIAIMLEFG